MYEPESFKRKKEELFKLFAGIPIEECKEMLEFWDKHHTKESTKASEKPFVCKITGGACDWSCVEFGRENCK